MKKITKKILSLVTAFALLVSNFIPFIPMMEVKAEGENLINEIRITSNTASVAEGVLPEFSVNTTTEHISIQEYGSNTNWMKWEDGMNSWHGFGTEIPAAVDDGTHYALRLQLNVDAGYDFSENTKIYFNGIDITGTNHTMLDYLAFDWGGYLYIDLGEVVDTHTVTFNSNGGSLVDSVTVPNGSMINAPSNPTKDNKVFNGWHDNSTLNSIFDFSTPITDDITLFADWVDDNAEPTYRISYDFNGGLKENESTYEEYSVAVGMILSYDNLITNMGVTAPNDMVLDAVEINGTRYELDSNYLLNQDTNIRYIWRNNNSNNNNNSYTVTFYVDGNELTSRSIPSGQTVDIPQNPVKDNYIFDAWCIDESLNVAFDFSTPITNDVNLFARFIQDNSFHPENYSLLEFGGEPTEISEANGSSNVVISYPNGTLTVTGNGLYSNTTRNNNGNFEVYTLGDVTITANPNDDYSVVIWDNGDQVDGNIKLLNGLTSNDHHRIDALFEESNNNHGNTNGVVNYTYSGSGADILINDSRFDLENANGMGNENETNLSGEINYNYNDSGYVTINLETLFIDRLTSIVVNGVDYTNNTSTSTIFPKTPSEILEAIRDQRIHYQVVVPHADTYNITTTSVENLGEYMTVGNFLWSYMDQDKGTDDYVGNGTFELVSLKYNNHEYSEDELRELNLGYMQWGQSDDEGGAMFPAGAELTVRLLPDKGYQLTSFTINGGEFEAGNDVGIYTFEVPRGNFHLGAHFTKVNDIVDSSESDAIKSGSIKLANGESTIEVGTARLDVKDIELEPNQISNFEDAASGYNISSYLDISLYNTVYKGSEDDVWDERLDELDKDATITLKLADGVDGNEVVIVHEKHDGTYEIIETTYDPVNNTISFKTSSFSNYAIAARTVENTENKTTSDTKTNVKTGSNPYTVDTIITWVTISILSITAIVLGLIIFRKRIKG